MTILTKMMMVMAKWHGGKGKDEGWLDKRYLELTLLQNTRTVAFY